jgi:DNA-binding XRE family transcriptional regulator
VPQHESLTEQDLAVLAKRFRKQTKKSQAQTAREMQVSRVSIFNAEENPSQSLLKLRIRMIEMYSPYKLEGPFYVLKRK